MSIRLLILLIISINLLSSTTLSLAKQQPKKMTVSGIRVPLQVEVAASVKGDVKLERGIYLFKIYCALESCSVERISLNECVQDKKGISSFTPKMDYWNSWSKTLEANLSGNVLELLLFHTVNHNFPPPAKLTLNFDPPLNQPFKLISFKASGFIDVRAWPDTDARIEYASLYDDQLKQLDCPVFLPGIHH